MTLTIYHNPCCSKPRATLALLKAKGLKLKVVDYLKTLPAAAELKAILQKFELKPQDILRKSEPLHAELDLRQRYLDDDALIALMVEHPSLSSGRSWSSAARLSSAGRREGPGNSLSAA
jgi:arsenate reductase